MWRLFNMEEWLCEDHPEEEMGHDGCDSAGIPKEAQMFMLVMQRRNAIQKYNNCKWLYEDMIYGLVKRIEELENAT